MIYRKYGSTGIEISAIAFGGMRLGNDKGKAVSLIEKAYDSGINYFDTAPGYEKSEEIFGIAFKGMMKHRKKKPFYISTKSMGRNPSEVRKDLENSLKRMKIDSLDFYHVWAVLTLENFRDRVKNKVIKEFEKIKDEGIAKHICISTHMNGEDIRKVLNDYPFEGVLLGYSAMNFPYREEALNATTELSRGLVVMNPLGGGIIPGNPELFSFLKTRKDESVTEAALRFLINDSRITSSLVGFSNEGQLAEAISAIDGFKKIPDAKLAKVRDKLSSSFNMLCTSCNYCNSCPHGIPVPKFMDSYNMKVLLKSELMLKQRLAWHWGLSAEKAMEAIAKCSECGLCEKKCTQKLPIIERLSEINTILGQIKETI